MKYFYYTNHKLSIEISKYFAEGFNINCEEINKIKDIKESGFFYGVLRRCYDGMLYLKSIGKDFFYVDHGFVSEVDDTKYYRICKNSRFLNFFIDDMPSDRFNKIFKNIDYEKNKGEKIVIFEPSPFVCMLQGLNQVQWVNNVIKKIRKYTDRDIIVSRKSNSENKNIFENMYVLVHYASMGAIEALVKNIPIITLGDFFLENYYNNSIEDIENLKYCENREKILYNISYSQYTLEEIRSGYAKRILEEIGVYND